MRRILGEQGTVSGDIPLDVADVRRLYEAMVEARAYDRKGSSLQRQGRLATYAQLEGQEAAQIGSAAALREDDWMVATYRDAAAMWMHGYPWSLLLLGRTGDERGGSPPEGVRVLPPAITVGAHMLHAVGLAWAERLGASDAIAITYFGDGATSAGDFHEAMNFAAVFSTATVFLCENNQYAISMPRARQTASATIAQKADAYGMPGTQVDGNDLFAVYAATSEAVARARRGDGPSLIEAVTYRIGPHTTSDDPSRYRPAGEMESWRVRDPLERVRRYLESEGAWDDTWQADIEDRAVARVDEAAEEAEAPPPLEREEAFEAMFEEPTRQLLQQRDAQ